MLREINYRNTTISYRLQGQGNCIVLLHGFLENLSIWKDISIELEKKFKVISIDLPGHGNSDCLSYVHEMEDMAETVRFVLQNERIRRCVLIGHSMGGYVSLGFAEKYPKMVKGLCLVNSTAVEDSEQRKQLRDLAIKNAKKAYEKVVRISVRNLFSQQNQIERKTEVDEVISEAIKTPLQGYIAAQEGMKLRPNREDVLKNANFHKLQITGKFDEVIRLAEVKKESQRTQVILKVLNGGHMSFIENKKELEELLISFVKNC